MYISESNKEINATEIKLCNSANLQKIQVSSSLRLPQECSNLRASGLCILEQSPGRLIVHCSKNFLVVKPIHQEQRRELTKNVNLKRDLLTVPPRQRRQNLIEVLPAHKNI